MVMRFSDPFEALLNFQKQLEARLASDWLGNSTANMGGYPPINIFQQQDDFVAIVELPGVSKTDLTIEAKEGNRKEDAGLPGERQHSSPRASCRQVRSNHHFADQNRSRPDQG